MIRISNSATAIAIIAILATMVCTIIIEDNSMHVARVDAAVAETLLRRAHGHVEFLDVGTLQA